MEIRSINSLVQKGNIPFMSIKISSLQLETFFNFPLESQNSDMANIRPNQITQ